MTRPRNLRANYRRLDEQITDTVVDAIELSPRSSGRLSLPGAYSTDNRPPRHDVCIAAAGPGVEYEQKLLGSAEKYHVMYEVKNFRDSISFVHLELLTD